MNDKPKILLVDDRPENLVALEKILADMDLELIKASSGNEALAKLLENDFALALMDVQMPDMDGFETVEIMRMDEKNHKLPVIFVSAIYGETHHLIKGIESGAIDFITKPIVPEILCGKVRIFVQLYEQRKKLEQLSITDGLTSTYNHQYIVHRLGEEIKKAQRYNHKLSTIMLDIDNFKSINDAYGHPAGDKILIAVADTIRENVREADCVGRYGGEEFTVILPEIDRDQAMVAAERIRHNIADLSFKNMDTKVTISGGVCEFNGDTVLSLLTRADELLYTAKRNGRNRIER